MKLSEININKLDSEIVSKVLFTVPKDDMKNGDLIFVFGTPYDWKNRMDVAINLYKTGRASKLLITGGVGVESTTKDSLVMRDYAIDCGVLDSDILIEDQSRNTTENVLCSLLILHRANLLPGLRRVLVVSSPAHIRRCMLTFSKYMPRGIEYSYCYDEDSIYSEKNWEKDEAVQEKLFLEVKNIIKYIKEGIIDDCELSI